MIQNEGYKLMMKKQSLNALAASYRADLLYYIERAKQGNCAPCWQDYCMEELAAAKDTRRLPEDGDALQAELQRLTAAVPQITNREAERSGACRIRRQAAVLP